MYCSIAAFRVLRVVSSFKFSLEFSFSSGTLVELDSIYSIFALQKCMTDRQTDKQTQTNKLNN